MYKKNIVYAGFRTICVLFRHPQEGEVGLKTYPPKDEEETTA